jgi:hypothetical protein
MMFFKELLTDHVEQYVDKPGNQPSEKFLCSTIGVIVPLDVQRHRRLFGINKLIISE